VNVLDYPPHGLTRYKKGPDQQGTPGKGCRCARCREANRAYQRHRARMVAYGRWDGWVDATGTHRRIRALMRNGWSLGRLSEKLGCDRQVLRKKLHDRERVLGATARAVRELYDDLWNTPPPEGNRAERRAATMARRYAEERGWVPPGAWDDGPGPHYIDDPVAVPADGWERGGGRERWTLADEVADLLGLGLDVQRVADRLGVSVRTVQRHGAARDAAA
jgi:hypothetical protein